jgi:signal transduction histidine kinase
LPVPPEPAIELTVDGRALQQALVNLIDNAIKHSAKGETVTVGIEQVPPAIPGPRPSPGAATYVGETPSGLPKVLPPANLAAPGTGAPTVIHLWVADHGPGIPAAEQDRIFERFYRRGSELRRETQGIGIGLSIVKHIMTAHGGRVLVDSAPGRGSRFTLELPAEKAESGKAGKRKLEA